MADNKENPWNIGGPKPSYESIVDMKFEDDHTHKIRVLPAKQGELPFFRYVTHWVPQANSNKSLPITCEWGARTVIDEFISEQWNEINRLKEEEGMTDKSPEIARVLKVIDPIRAQKKCDMNVIDREDSFTKSAEGKKILTKRLSANSAIWKAIFDYAQNPKWGNPSDEENGYDFEIVTEGAGMRRKYSVVPDRDASPLTDEEKEAIKTAYDLKKLRKITSLKDMKDILKNAKDPYDSIADRIPAAAADGGDEEAAPAPKAKETPKAKEEPPKETPPPKAKVKEEDDNDFLNDKPANNSDDPKDLNSYSCKGEFAEGDDDCAGCPVKEDCTNFKGFYQKARELGINVDVERTWQEITNDVKKKAPAAPAPKLGKKKDIPF